LVRGPHLLVRSLMAAALMPSALLALATAAEAQSRFETITTINAPPTPAEVRRRQRGAPPAAAQQPDDESLGAGFQTQVTPAPLTDFAAPTQTDETPAAVGGPSLGQNAGFPSTPVSTIPPSVGLPTDPPRRRPTLPVDGDFSAPVQPAAPVDGDFSAPDPTQAIDGADPVSNDIREDADRAAFSSPPAGFDPTLFGIDVSPILSERPRRLFRFEPYTPIGIRAGSFVILPVLETSVLFDSNTFESSPAQSDRAIELLPTVRVVSNWSVHAIELRASGVVSQFQEFDSENDRAYTLEARGRLDITRRTNLEGLVSRAVSQEGRDDINAAASGDRADVTRDQYALTLNHRFNRLRLQLRGSHIDEDVSDTATDVNDDRDERESEIAIRASWEFKPTLFAFAEAAVNTRKFGAASSDDGLRRDSRGVRYRAGLSFGNTDQILRGEVSLGYGRQSPDEAALSDVSGLLVDANLAWRISGLTTLLFTANTSIDDSTDANVSGVISRSANVELRHSFRRNLVGSIGTGIEVRKFEGPSETEKEVTAIAGLEYFMNRNVTLFGRYQFTRFDGGEDYVDNEFRLGLRLSR